MTGVSVLAGVALLAEGAVDGSPSSTVTVAAIGAVSLIITSLIAGWFGTRGGRPGHDCRDAELGEAYAEHERREAEAEADRWRRRYDVLCVALWRRRLDPNKFVTGEESDDAAKF